MIQFNLFFPCSFVPHRTGCESKEAYNLNVTTCQKCLKTGHSTSPPYENRQIISREKNCQELGKGDSWKKANWTHFFCPKKLTWLSSTIALGIQIISFKKWHIAQGYIILSWYSAVPCLSVKCNLDSETDDCHRKPNSDTEII